MKSTLIFLSISVFTRISSLLLSSDVSQIQEIYREKAGSTKNEYYAPSEFFLPLVAELPCKLSALLLLKRYAVYIVLCSSQTIVNFKILYLCQAYRQVLTYLLTSKKPL